MKGFDRLQISKKCWESNNLKNVLGLTKKTINILERSSTLRVSRAEIWLTVYRSIYIRMQEGFDSHWARALKYFFLPCDPAGKINSLYNDEVYHSRCNYICMNEMCDNIKPGASWKWVSDHISDAKTYQQNEKLNK